MPTTTIDPNAVLKLLAADTAAVAADEKKLAKDVAAEETEIAQAVENATVLPKPAPLPAHAPTAIPKLAPQKHSIIPPRPVKRPKAPTPAPHLPLPRHGVDYAWARPNLADL